MNLHLPYALRLLRWPVLVAAAAASASASAHKERCDCDAHCKSTGLGVAVGVPEREAAGHDEKRQARHAHRVPLLEHLRAAPATFVAICIELCKTNANCSPRRSGQ